MGESLPSPKGEIWSNQSIENKVRTMSKISRHAAQIYFLLSQKTNQCIYMGCVENLMCKTTLFYVINDKTPASNSIAEASIWTAHLLCYRGIKVQAESRCFRHSAHLSRRMMAAAFFLGLILALLQSIVYARVPPSFLHNNGQGTFIILIVHFRQTQVLKNLKSMRKWLFVFVWRSFSIPVLLPLWITAGK